MAKKFIRISFITLFIVNFSTLFLNGATNDPSTVPSVGSEPDVSSPAFNFDGIISAGEWDEDNKTTFSLNVENGDGDVDGPNYLYLGRDASNLYVAYDFVSDRTDDDSGEWFGMWFNTHQRTFASEQQWHDYLNNGTESFIYQIDDEQVCPYLDPLNEPAPGAKGLNNDSEYAVKYGYTTGNYVFNGFKVVSQQVGANYLYWINFSIYMPYWFPMFPQIYINNISTFRFLFTHTLNVSIAGGEHKLIIWNPDGTMPALDDPNQVLALSTASGFQSNDYYIGTGNITADNRIRFTLFGNNSSPFNYSTDQLSWFPRTHASYELNEWWDQPYTSLTNYAIKWSFQGSLNNASAHRMIEIVFPLNQFEQYNPENALAFLIGGYGTLSFPGTDHWCYPYTAPFPVDESAHYQAKYVALMKEETSNDEDDDDDDDEKDEKETPITIVGFEAWIIIAVLGVLSLSIARKYQKSVNKF